MNILQIALVFFFSNVVLSDNSCVFRHPTEGVINLSPLGLRTGQPRFRDIASSSGDSFTYSFNPCYSFTENGCSDVAICQQAKDQVFQYSLAKQNASNWSLDSNKSPVLTYTYGEKTVKITMICSSIDEDSFEVIGEDVMNHYSMILRSRCACWNGCTAPHSSTTSSRRPPDTTRTYYSSACRYSDSKYGTIDLSWIGSMAGQPIFKDVSAIHPNNYVWSYNPCYKFSESTCQNVAACQIDKAYSIGYTIGLQDYAYWVNMSDAKHHDPWIIYPSPENNRRLSVQLICDQERPTHHLQVIGEIAPGEYFMKLTSRCACWNGCLEPTPRPTPFTGHFWLIVCISASAVFLLFCMLITCLFFSKPKRAKRNVIFDEKTPLFRSINNHNF